MPSSPRRRIGPISRRIYWLVIFTWGILAYIVGTNIAQDMVWRINDLSSIPGAGVMMRDNSGSLYHVNGNGVARQIYPTLAPTNSHYDCLDCTAVSGALLAQTNKFCAAAKPVDLPKLTWEIPCKAWAPINQGPKIIAVVLFLAPFALITLFRFFAKMARDRKKRPASDN